MLHGKISPNFVKRSRTRDWKQDSKQNPSSGYASPETGTQGSSLLHDSLQSSSANHSGIGTSSGRVATETPTSISSSPSNPILVVEGDGNASQSNAQATQNTTRRRKNLNKTPRKTSSWKRDNSLDPVATLFFRAPVASLVRPFVQQVAGTPAYLAPEVLGRRASFSSDLWSLGVLMFRCLAGTIPYKAKSRAAMLTAISQGDIRWEKIPRQCSPETLAFLSSLLQVNPSQRLGSALGVDELRIQPFLTSRIVWGSLYNGNAPLSRMKKHVTVRPASGYDSRATAQAMVDQARTSVKLRLGEYNPPDPREIHHQISQSIAAMQPRAVRKAAAELIRVKRLGMRSSSSMEGSNSGSRTIQIPSKLSSSSRRSATGESADGNRSPLETDDATARLANV